MLFAVCSDNMLDKHHFVDRVHECSVTVSSLVSGVVVANGLGRSSVVAETYICARFPHTSIPPPPVYPAASQLSVTDFAPDGLHPKTRLGQHTLAAILKHWLRTASRRSTHSRPNAPAATAPPYGLPRALHPRNVNQRPPTTSPRCYHFGMQTGSGTFRRYSVLRPLAWHTAACPRMPAAASLLGEACAQVDPTPGPKCPEFLPPEDDRAAPQTWLYCSHSLPPRRSSAATKIMAGVVALREGALLELPLELPVQMVGEDGNISTAASPARHAFRVTIDYLTSYESIGRATLACGAGCTCEEQHIDGHRPAKHASDLVSIFHQHSLTVLQSTVPMGESGSNGSILTASGQEQQGRWICVVRLRVDHGTSSGGHKFRLRMLRIAQIVPEVLP